MMPYSLPYVLFVLFLLVIGIVQLGIPLDQKSRKMLNGLVIIAYVCFFGFRGFIGWDWHNYYPFYKSVQPIYKVNVHHLVYEPGFSIFSSLIKTVCVDYSFFVFVNTVIDVTLLHLFFKRYLPDYLYAFAFAVFIVMGGLVFQIDLLRNIKGLFLFLLSICYIEKRKILPFFALNALGILFHWSSIIFFPLYFFVHRKINIRIILIIVIIGNLIYLFQIQYVKPLVQVISFFLGGRVEGKSEFYLNSDLFNKSYGITIGYIERLFSTILVLIYYHRLMEKSRSMVIFVNCFFIYFIFFFYFSELSIIISRIARLFYFSYWIIWPVIIEESKNTSKYIMFVFLSFFMILKTVKSTNNILYKYDNNLLGKTMSHEAREEIFNKNAYILQKND